MAAFAAKKWHRTIPVASVQDCLKWENGASAMCVYRNDSYQAYARQVYRCGDGPSCGSCRDRIRAADGATM